MPLKIAISSGKGGTGKTFVAVNIADSLARLGNDTEYLDCDVEEPNGHLFLKPLIEENEPVHIFSPAKADMDKCDGCRKCAEVCKFNAVAVMKGKPLFFKNICHACGACVTVCPQNAIIEEEREIGRLKTGKSQTLNVRYAELKTAESGMSPRLIGEVKKGARGQIQILDSPPGTSCPSVETVKDADLCVLITDPTPFSIHDLKLSTKMCRSLGKEPVVIINKGCENEESLNGFLNEEEIKVIGRIEEDMEAARNYSKGELLCRSMEKYEKLFEGLSLDILEAAKNPPELKGKSRKEDILPSNIKEEESASFQGEQRSSGMKELVVISGKGGTGKTSISAGLAVLEGRCAAADCDVDASDLHLVLKPEVQKQGIFSSSYCAVIDSAKCRRCGRCVNVCRFDAIKYSDERKYYIDPSSCEGCGACALVCPPDIISLEKQINGHWFESTCRIGPMVHAELGAGEENSGKLVSIVRERKDALMHENDINLSIVDGSPGTGCPVISSITATDYALIVSEPGVSGLHDLKRILDLTKHFGVPSAVLVNKADINEQMCREIENLSKEYGAHFIGRIDYDADFSKAQIEGKTIVEYKDDGASARLKEVWDKLKLKLFE